MHLTPLRGKPHTMTRTPRTTIMEPHLIPGTIVVISNRTGADLFGIIVERRGSAWAIKYLDGTDHDLVLHSASVIRPLARSVPTPPLTLNHSWFRAQREVAAPDPAELLRRRRSVASARLAKRVQTLTSDQLTRLSELLA